MKTLGRLSIAALFALGLSPAFAQAPPVVPALPDTPRLTSYTIAGTTCACAVNFALYGNANLADYQDWVEVFLNGVKVAYNDPTYGWTITSPTGALASIARPVTDAVLTFTNVQIGTVEIVGAARPARLSQWSENQGVSARNLNVAFTGIVAQLREVWDKINDVSGRDLKSQPGNTVGLLPLPAACSNAFLGFDSTGLNPLCRVGAGSGNVLGPLTSTVNHLAAFGNVTGSALLDIALGTHLSIGSSTLSTDATGTGVLATKGDIGVALPSLTTSQLYGGTGGAGVAQHFPAGTGVETALQAAVDGTGGLASHAGVATALPSLTTSQLYGGTGAAGAAQLFPAGAGVSAWLQTPTSANLAAAVPDETGSGALVFANSPVLVTPNLGTPSAINLANATNLPPFACPLPGLSTVGCVEAINLASHQWVAYIDTSGVPHLSQPAIGDVSGWGTNVAAALGNTLDGTGGVASHTAVLAALPSATASQFYIGTAAAGVTAVASLGSHLSLSGASLSTDAASANTPSTIVARDGSGNFSAGTVTASLTGHASLDLPLTGGTMSGPINMGSQAITNIPSLPNLSSNVESTGIPGLDVGHWFIWNNSATLDTINTLRVDRQVSYTGGTPGNTYDAFWANCVVGANVADYEWCNKTVVTNNATAGQSVAIYGQITKTSTGPTWGFVTQALDTSLAANPTGGLYGQEIDIEASGTDTNLARFGLDIIGWTVPSGTKPTFSYGVFIECSGNSSANCQYTNGVALGTATYNIGLNLAAGTFTTYSIDAPGFTVDPTGNTIANSFSATTTIQTGGYAIGSLPTCNTGAKGLRTFVTNAQTTPTFLGTVSTTGAVVAPVFCNGSNWIYGLLDTPANDSLDVTELAA